MSAPTWEQHQRTADRNRKHRHLKQFTKDRVFLYAKKDDPRSGEPVSVVRSPRLDVKNPSVRVVFTDGEQRTVRTSALKRLESDPFNRPLPAPEPPQPAGREGQPIIHPSEPPAPTTTKALHRITQDARAEINLIAQSIHRRHFVETPRPERIGGHPHGPSSPRRDRTATSVRENWFGSYSNALEACRQLSVGNYEHAAYYAEQALAQKAHYRAASKQLEQTQTRLSTGRFFHGELLSIRHYHKNDNPKLKAAFQQWYVRLVLIWQEDGVSLTVANAAQLEGETGLEVGPDGWADLVRWISDLTEIYDGQRRGRRMDDDHTLIYLWREDEERYVLRRRVYQTYPALPRAFEGLRLAMHRLEVAALDIGELPENQPVPGYHPPEWNEIAIDDRFDD
ncbi:hypothetical protein MF271_19440 (plasmid) [Deinococcus sp. KNUC1210]|uniref:hypothetical protein n=1 Tax=Deinococcus sp. KNUC1210 TaxID=2917691 RepID=UPI001EF0CC29|nr:hypothetical protein [Deinococcus sp. KNUC1210]ULH17366.1 hypothetical protein MF271_19440 [Deinococcus sp. KNUC1210]